MTAEHPHVLDCRPAFSGSLGKLSINKPKYSRGSVVQAGVRQLLRFPSRLQPSPRDQALSEGARTISGELIGQIMKHFVHSEQIMVN